MLKLVIIRLLHLLMMLVMPANDGKVGDDMLVTSSDDGKVGDN
jgi:hypothetical protein